MCPTGEVDQGLAAAGLRGFREEAFGSLGRRRDALFELVDGLLAAESMASLPHVSLLPVHRRGWGSVYAALAVGEVDADRIAEMLAAHAPDVAGPVFAVDASTWPRCDAECSPDRGFYYSSTRHSAGQPFVAGWCYSWMARLTPARLVDRPGRCPPSAGRRGHRPVTAAQIRGLAGRLARGRAAPLFVCDAGYDPIALTVDLADLPVAVLVRIRCDRVFYTAPVPVRGGWAARRGTAPAFSAPTRPAGGPRPDPGHRG